MSPKYLYLNSRDSLLRLDVSHLVYFMADGNYTHIISANKVKYTIGMTLAKMMTSSVRAIPFPIKKLCWRSSCKGLPCTLGKLTGRYFFFTCAGTDGMRVGLDCSNGSTFNIAKSVFDALGAKTYVVGNEPDGTNINMGCGSTHIENLQRLVREKNLDCGFVYVSQMRSWLPREVGGILWFGNDDANMVAFTPVYCCTSVAPLPYNTPGADNITFSMDNAFWVGNWVSNMV